MRYRERRQKPCRVCRAPSSLPCPAQMPQENIGCTCTLGWALFGHCHPRAARFQGHIQLMGYPSEASLGSWLSGRCPARGAFTWQPPPGACRRTVASSRRLSHSQKASSTSGGPVAAARPRQSGEKARDTGASRAGSSAAVSTLLLRGGCPAASSYTVSTGCSAAVSDTARNRRSGLTASACTPRLFSRPAGKRAVSTARRAPAPAPGTGTGSGATWEEGLLPVLGVQPGAARAGGVQHLPLAHEADATAHPRPAAEDGDGLRHRGRHGAVGPATAAPAEGAVASACPQGAVRRWRRWGS